jgi:hypothetical protein
MHTDENQMDEPPRQEDTVLNQISDKIMNYRVFASLSSKLIKHYHLHFNVSNSIKTRHQGRRRTITFSQEERKNRK